MAEELRGSTLKQSSTGLPSLTPRGDVDNEAGSGASKLELRPSEMADKDLDGSTVYQKKLSGTQSHVQNEVSELRYRA